MINKYLSLASLICLCISTELFSQQQFTWYETVSPVTTRLNGIDAYGSGYPNHFWFCGNNGVVFKTTNNGLSYINRTGNGIPINVNLITIAVFDTINIVAGGVRNDTAFAYRTTNGGLSWQQTFVQPHGYINSINERVTYPVQNQIGLMAGNPVGGRWSLWRTTNSGANWDSTGKYVPQAGTETGFPGSLVYIDSLIMFGTNNSRIYRSTTQGAVWTTVMITGEQDPSAFDMGPFWGYLFPYGDVGGLTSIQSSINSGATWTNNPYTLQGTGRILALEGHPGGVFDYSFSDNWYVRNDNNIYHCGYGAWQVHYTAPSGNYTYMSQGDQISIFIAAVRDNGGISFCNCQIWGGVKNLGGPVPESFSLYQNYPNPFNPSTKIKFDIPVGNGRDRFVMLKVFNSLGQEVALLINEQLQPGTYEVEWYAADYPSGVYFYRLEAGNFAETKKMLMIK